MKKIFEKIRDFFEYDFYDFIEGAIAVAFFLLLLSVGFLFLTIALRLLGRI